MAQARETINPAAVSGPQDQRQSWHFKDVDKNQGVRVFETHKREYLYIGLE
jgi:hypothetical protein